MRHAVNARIGSASTLAAVGIEFLLRQDVAASLEYRELVPVSAWLPNQDESINVPRKKRTPSLRLTAQAKLDPWKIVKWRLKQWRSGELSGGHV